jgi:hypothetical protein
MQTQTAIAPIELTPPAAHAIFNQFWPPAVLAVGIGLTAAWITLLGYVLVVIMELAL